MQPLFAFREALLARYEKFEKFHQVVDLLEHIKLSGIQVDLRVTMPDGSAGVVEWETIFDFLCHVGGLAHSPKLIQQRDLMAQWFIELEGQIKAEQLLTQCEDKRVILQSLRYTLAELIDPKEN